MTVLRRSEIEAGRVTSLGRSGYAARELEKGRVLEKEDPTLLRPEHGVPAYCFDVVLSQRAARHIRLHEVT